MIDDTFCPMPPMPPEISKALYGTSTPTDEPEFRPYVPPTNPWAKKVDGDGRLNFIDEDEEEIALQAPIEHIKKLFAPPTPARIAPKLGELPARFEDPDDEERAFCTPIAKLFHPSVTVTPIEAPKFQFTKRATTPPPVPAPEVPLEKSGTGLDTFAEELEAGLQEALDQAIEDCLPSEDESTFDFFRRVDRRLEALGHRPILSIPTWVSY